MYINDYIKDKIPNRMNNKDIFIETVSISPTPERIIQELINKTYLISKVPSIERWKKEWLDDVNRAEGKSYDLNMSNEEFIKVLEKEGIIRIEYLEDKSENISLQVDTPKTEKKGQIKLF